MRKEDSNNVFSNSIKLWWRGIDQQIILALVILFVFSMMLVTTSGSAVATRIGLDEHYFSFRQVFYLGAAAVLIILFSSLEQKWLRRVAILGFIISIILLIGYLNE